MKSHVTDEMKLMLNNRDAALVCGITPRIWRVWHKMGYTPLPIKVGKRLFWKYKELADWIAAGCPKREVWMRSGNANRNTGDFSPQVITISKPRGLREKIQK